MIKRFIWRLLGRCPLDGGRLRAFDGRTLICDNCGTKYKTGM